MSDAGEATEILNEFLVESYEGLDQLDRDLIELEARGATTELIGRVFRCVHTIKGTCGFLGFGKLEAVAHVGENLLSRVRDGAVAVSPEMTTTLLALIDAAREILRHIEQHGDEGPSEHATLIDNLACLAEGFPIRTATTPTTPSTDEMVPPSPRLGEVLVQQGHVSEADVAAAVHEQETTPLPVGEILVARGAATPGNVKDALELQQEARGANIAEGNIRVDVALLDRLMNLVGELVLARNQILQCTTSNADSTLLGTTQRLNLITSELQEGVMKTRMQPIGNVWSKFPRVVRDLAVQCGKQVVITMEGAETELDKTIIEAIKDPLTHIIRNSIDHGIESPRDRVLNDKRPEGRLVLRAFHEGGQVNIEIIDDGAGIDPAKLRAKAVEKGLLTADAAQRLSEREALNLIFAAGFSTAARITNVSGRGVGMDVVRTNIEKIGGTVDVTSVIGAGTTLRIKIPLTLAIIPGLVVTSGGERFAIPQVSLLELVRMEHDEARRKIEMIHGAPVYRLRGKLLPLVHLNHTLSLAKTPWPSDQDASDEPFNIVVLHTDGLPFGLVVDRINDTEEIVVKPLSKQLKGITAFAGATIMGDGHVALILDVHGLAHRAGVLTPDRDRGATEQHSAKRNEQDAMHTLLVFDLGADHHLALPLSEIERLEEFPPDVVERTGHQQVVQYRDHIMPLIRLSDVLGGAQYETDANRLLQVIVFSHNEHYVGLVVDRIVDIVETTVSIQRRRQSGIIVGSAVIQNRVTDILDMGRLVQSQELELLTSAGTSHSPESVYHG